MQFCLAMTSVLYDFSTFVLLHLDLRSCQVFDFPACFRGAAPQLAQCGEGGCRVRAFAWRGALARQPGLDDGCALTWGTRRCH